MKTVKGVVISAKMKKAVVVRVERLVEHPVYTKIMIQRTKVHARDEVGCHEGDVVQLESTRPLSRTIHWRVIKVVGRKAIPDAPDEAALKLAKPAKPAKPAAAAS